MTTFEFFRLRFHFRAVDEIRLPAHAGNAVRGAFGAALRETAPAEEYARIFEPRQVGAGPSGLSDWPRPFVFRASQLNGMAIPSGARFFLDVHLFDLRAAAVECMRSALEFMAECGIGRPPRGRARLERLEWLDLSDRVTESGPNVVALDSVTERVEHVRLRFVTPTELKGGGELVERPEFPVLFARLRDRISTLRSLYGGGPLEISFRELGERAAAVRLRWCELKWEDAERRSARTGQVHPMGGFTGEAEYEGSLGEFVPWLRAARWVGVGRQTVWGKGDVRIE